MESALVRRTSAAGVVEENRRLYPRRRVTFPAAFAIDGDPLLPAFGLEISGGGLRLFTRDPIDAEGNRAFSLVAVLEGRKVHLRAARRWTTSFEAPAGTRYRHGLQLRTIADADWEFVMDLTADARGVLSAGQLDRLLSLEKQVRVAAALDAAGRLSDKRDGRPPLIEYGFDGYAMRRSVPYYRFTVRSKAQRPSGLEEFRSRVLVAIQNDHVLLVDEA